MNTRLSALEPESEFNYRLLFEKNPSPMWVYRKSDFRFLAVNEAALRSYGYSQEEFLAMTVLDIRPESEIPLFLNATRTTNVPLQEVYFKHQRRNGEVFDVEILFEEMEFQGQPARLIIARDVTQLLETNRKRDAAARKAEEAYSFLETLLEASPIGYTCIDSEMRYVRINESMTRLCGISVEDHLGRTVREVVPHLADRVEPVIREVIATRKPKLNLEISVPAATLDQKPGFWLASFFPIASPEHRITGVGVTVIDVSAQKLAELDLRETVLQRDQFIVLLSHDLRTPLTVARASAELIQRRMDPKDPMHALGRQIAQSVERADQMIRDLLDANRIRAGQVLPMAIKQCVLNRMLEELRQDIRTLYNVEIKLEIASEIQGHWSCRDVRRAIENLVSNGIKYGDGKSPIDVLARETGENIHITVRNYGKPISPDEQKALFRPFQRLQSAESSGKHGWGLGLTLVRGVADSHGGRVELTSSLEKGTCFTLILPKDSRHRSSAMR